MQEGTETSVGGVDRDAIKAALVASEPMRLKAFSASVNLIVAIGLSVGSAPSFIGGVWGQALLGLFAAALAWRLSNFMWRPRAIAVAAPLLGSGWGQATLDVGLAAIDWSEWWEEWGMRGLRLVGWRSSGSYRKISYSVQEVTTMRRRHKHGPSQTTHSLVVSVSVPKPFAGTIDIQAASGLISELDGALRKLTGDELQRVAVEPLYDSRFDTLATANAEIDKVLTPAFQATMLALSEQHRGLAGRFSFGWFRLYLTIPDVSFRSARLHRPLPDLAWEADQLWWELTVPHRLIDALMGDHQGSLR